MLDPTNHLNNLNKRIEISSSEIANVQLKESFVLNSRRNASDLVSIGDYINEVIVRSYSTLCSNPRYPKDALANGLSGSTIVTWLEEDGNNKYNSPIFWFSSENPDNDGRPCTIKESFQYIWENLNQRVIENRADPTDLSEIENSLSCLDSMLDRLKIDTFGNSFILTCNDEWTKQTWPISKHVFEILNQLTTGHLIDNINGLNKVSEPAYPDLSWSIELNDLLDVDLESVPPNHGDALIYDGTTEKWQPGSADVKWIDELYDVDTSSTQPVENDILVWDPNHKDSQGSSDPEHDGAWVPVSPDTLFSDSTLEYAYELKDVDYGDGATKAGNGQILVWRTDEDPDNDGGIQGAWVPEYPDTSSSSSDLFGTGLCPGETLDNKDFLVYTNNCGDNQSVSSPGWVAQNKYNPMLTTKLPYASPARNTLWNKDTEDNLNIDWDDNTIFPGLVGVASDYEISKLWSFNLDVYNTENLIDGSLKSGSLISYVLTADRFITSLIGKTISGVPGALQTENSASEGVAFYDPSYHTASEVSALQADVTHMHVEVNLLQQNVTNFFLSRLNRSSITELADVNTSGGGVKANDLLVWEPNEIDDSGLQNTGCWKPKELSTIMSELGISTGSGSSTTALDQIVEQGSIVEVIDDGSTQAIVLMTDSTKRWIVNANGHMLPYANASYDIGSAEKKVRHLFLSDNSLHIGVNTLGAAGGIPKWNSTFSIPVYSGAPENNDVLKWDGAGWSPSPESVSSPSGSGIEGSFENGISNEFSIEVNYDSNGYNLGTGKSHHMFQFKNQQSAAITIKGFSILCKEMYSSTIELSFAKCQTAELLGNVFTTASDVKTMNRVNTDPQANNVGVGLVEGSVEVSLNSGEWIVVFLNFYEKVTDSNKDWYIQLKYTE
tara:strand:- start:42495 stop:45176 length:2682 start_codon:yes stop_codon:yes gene_type:complete